MKRIHFKDLKCGDYFVPYENSPHIYRVGENNNVLIIPIRIHGIFNITPFLYENDVKMQYSSFYQTLNGMVFVDNMATLLTFSEVVEKLKKTISTNIELCQNKIEDYQNQIIECMIKIQTMEDTMKKSKELKLNLVEKLTKS